jgi:hypothetical protein
MAINPLQKHFRQPKIYIGLPSKGLYNEPGTVQGDVDRMPIYSMTGMDEIIMKTPDALLNGEATVKIIESCCPSIKDAWAITSLDLDLLLVAIKIATYGNKLEVGQQCPKCKAENQYEIELGKFIEHYSRYKYDNKIIFDDLTIKLRPLSYKSITALGLRNFSIQQQLRQIEKIIDLDERKTENFKLFETMSELQNDIFSGSIESIEVDGTVVTEKEFINDWLANCEKNIFDIMQAKINEVRDSLKTPAQTVICEGCQAENILSVDLDPASFFVSA